MGRCVLALALAAALGLPAPRAHAQAPDSTGISRGLDLESAGKYPAAAEAFRAGLRSDLISAVLGMERAYAALGWSDSLAPLIDSLVVAHPRESMLRTVQLRARHMAGRGAQAQAAFEAWVREVPREPQPYREYARLLLESGRTAGADSVLQRAQHALGSGRAVALELAQLRAQLGLWALSAGSWREALAEAAYLEQAAVFSLTATPAAQRDSVRGVLAAAPVVPAPRRTLARLELAWGDPDAAWGALQPLPPDDSTVAAWLAFAEEAQGGGAWRAAQLALTAVQRERPTPQHAARAATVALEAGDAEAALGFTADTERAGADSTRRALLPLRVRALSLLGRPADAERLVRTLADADAELARSLQRTLAWAWVRAGALDRARAALEASGGTGEGVEGWLALYAGDLAGARRTLRAGNGEGGDAVVALALLARTRADTAPLVGQAFLSLARADTTDAARAFAQSAEAHADAAPLLLATAARLHAARGDAKGAVALWERLLADHPGSAEAT